MTDKDSVNAKKPNYHPTLAKAVLSITYSEWKLKKDFKFGLCIKLDLPAIYFQQPVKLLKNYQRSVSELLFEDTIIPNNTLPIFN